MLQKEKEIYRIYLNVNREFHKEDSDKALPKYSETLIRSFDKPDDKDGYPSGSGCDDCSPKGIEECSPPQKSDFEESNHCIRCSTNIKRYKIFDEPEKIIEHVDDRYG